MQKYDFFLTYANIIYIFFIFFSFCNVYYTFMWIICHFPAVFAVNPSIFTHSSPNTGKLTERIFSLVDILAKRRTCPRNRKRQKGKTAQETSRLTCRMRKIISEKREKYLRMCNFCCTFACPNGSKRQRYAK